MKNIDVANFTVENGVTGRKIKNKREIIRVLSRASNSLSIPEISEIMDLSIPVTTNLIKELIADKLVLKEGKKTSENGRRPFLFSLNRENFLVIGVEILSKFLHFSITTTDLKTKFTRQDRSFVLSEKQDSLDHISTFMEDSIRESGVNLENIFAIGIGTPEVTKDVDGNLTLYFKADNISLKTFLENKFNLPVVIDNDSRTIGIAEQVLGAAKGVNNAIIIKVSRSLGLSIINERQIIKGSDGLAGNFSHTQFQKGDRPCSCGKIGCLGTLIGGDALLEDLKDSLQAGSRSVYFEKNSIEEYTYHRVLDAVLKGDELSLKLIQNQGNILGKAIGNLINILNPEMVIIGGEFAMLQSFFIDSVKGGIRKTVLINSLKKCEIKTSILGRYLGSTAGSSMVLKSFDMINF